MNGNLVVGSNDAVLKYACKVLKGKGMRLSTHVLGFYVRLVNLVYYHGYPGAEGSGVFCLCCTPLGLSEHMKEFQAKRIMLMLSKLAESGLITFEPNVNVPDDLVFGEKPFKKSKPFRITVEMREILFMDLNAILWYFNDEERYVLNQGSCAVKKHNKLDRYRQPPTLFRDMGTSHKRSDIKTRRSAFFGIVG